MAFSSAWKTRPLPPPRPRPPLPFLPPPWFGKLLITLLEVVGPTISVRRSPVLETIPSRGSLGGNKVGRGERIKEERRNGRKGERHEGGRRLIDIQREIKV